MTLKCVLQVLKQHSRPRLIREGWAWPSAGRTSRAGAAYFLNTKQGLAPTITSKLVTRLWFGERSRAEWPALRHGSMQRRRLLAVLLILQCAHLATACSDSVQQSDAAISDVEINALPRWDQLHHHRRLRQSSSGGAAVPGVTVKHLKRRQCGSQQPSNTTQASVQRRLAPHVAQIEFFRATQRLAAAPITIDVHMHAIRAGAAITPVTCTSFP
jgi:hypothetical protein